MGYCGVRAQGWNVALGLAAWEGAGFEVWTIFGILGERLGIGSDFGIGPGTRAHRP